MSLTLSYSLPRNLTVKTHGLLQLPNIDFRDVREMTFAEFMQLVQIYLYPNGTDVTDGGLKLWQSSEGYADIMDSGTVPYTPIMHLDPHDFLATVQYVIVNTPIRDRRLVSFDETTGDVDIQPHSDERIEFLNWLAKQLRPSDQKRGELYDWLRTVKVMPNVFPNSSDGRTWYDPGLVSA